ncbi:MAG: ribonuclease HII [Candidatus Eremiobacterota bacterium]
MTRHVHELLDLLTPDLGYAAARKRLSEELARAARRERARLAAMCREEKDLWASAVRFVAGADEVGRGPMAGPLVAAAVVFEEPPWIPGLNDSKQLTLEQREALVPWIHHQAAAWHVQEISVEEVSHGNLHELSLKAMMGAVRGLGLPVQHVLVDGRFQLPLPLPQTALIKGDARSASIAAASILAKVYRDRIMIESEARYPGYGFAHHKGYNTAEHLEALRRLGPCPLHRTSFAPVRACMAEQLTLGLA